MSRKRRRYFHTEDTGTLERETIIKCLVRAAVSAAKVSSRNHIVPERIQRVGEFVTALRRELGAIYGSRQTVYKMVEKNIWSDILVLQSGVFEFVDIPGLAGMVEAASLKLVQPTSEGIQLELNALNSTYDELEILLKEMDAVDVEAEQVLEKFETLAAEMEKQQD